MKSWGLGILLTFLLTAPAPADVVVKPESGGTGGGTLAGTNVWTGDNRFNDNLFTLRDNGDITKLTQFELSGITTGTTRTLTVPNASGTLAVLSLAQTWAAVQTIATSFLAGSGPLFRVNDATGNVGAAGNFQIGFTTGAAAGVTLNSGFTQHAGGVIGVTDGTQTTRRGLLGGGTAVASATALPLPTGNVFHVTGTTTITSITATNFQSGVCITLVFDGVLTLTDGSNLVLAGNFVTTADDVIRLCYDGTNWYESGRSVN